MWGIKMYLMWGRTKVASVERTDVPSENQVYEVLVCLYKGLSFIQNRCKKTSNILRSWAYVWLGWVWLHYISLKVSVVVVVGVGYDWKAVLRTGTKKRICPNTIPGLVNGTGIYILTFWICSIRNRNFKSLFWFWNLPELIFPKMFSIKKVLIKVWYAF